ncbi:MAG: bacteriohemerythrin [Brevinematales bacterium]|nr:bacteriohemerythrin [Brevinematales bacterium]
MAYIDWSSELSVGVNLFDEQHKKLVGIINKLYDAMKEGKGRNVLGEIFNELIEYTKFHFKAEEEVFLKYDYPGYSEQQREHSKLTKEVMDLKDKYDKGNIFITVEMLSFLKDWLSHHILEVDKKYGPYLKQKGIS